MSNIKKQNRLLTLDIAVQKASTPIENRLGSVKEIADIVAMLAGRDGAWITGQAISASGVSFIRFLRSCLSLSPPPHSVCVCVCVFLFVCVLLSRNGHDLGHYVLCPFPVN